MTPERARKLQKSGEKCNNHFMNEGRDKALGIYLSVPFCRTKCTYCNFASGVYPQALQGRYVERLGADLQQAGRQAEQLEVDLPRTVDSIYLGGGTPTLLSAAALKELFATLRNEFTLAPSVEITLEAMPGEIADDVLEAMCAVGVNRISLGVQSFIDSEVRRTGRKHAHSTILNDLARLRSAGITNINLDLIAGLAGQTTSSWNASLDALLAAEVPHASVYLLEVDEESRLGREVLAEGLRYHAAEVPGDDMMASFYERTITRLSDAGMAQYEISNFSHPGFESQHNLRYWLRRPYLGIGLDASSALRCTHGTHAGQLLRTTTTSNLTSYLEGAPLEESNWQDTGAQQEEAWFLGLRRNAGVCVDTLTEEFGAAALAPSLRVAQKLADDELLVMEGSNIRLTPRGRLLANDVFAAFINPAE